MRRTTVTKLVTLGVLAATVCAPARAEITAEQVRQSIDRGVAYLKREQKDGCWPEHPTLAGGVTGLATLALLNCGVPANDPQIRDALKYLRKIPPKWNYVVCLQTMVFCAADPTADALLIKRNVDWLEEQQKRVDKIKGAWGYPGGNGDNSNTQFAVLRCMRHSGPAFRFACKLGG